MGDELIHHSRAVAFQEQKNYRPAIKEYLRAIELDPVYVPLHVNLACCYFNIGQIDSARMALENALALEPNYAAALANQEVFKFLKLKSNVRQPVDSYFFDPEYFNSQVVKAARTAEIDIGLLLAIMDVESDYRVYACSYAGAAGLMQLMPATARELGLLVPARNESTKKLKILDPRKDERIHPLRNIQAATHYLEQLIARYRTSNWLDLRRPLGAYNMGPGAVPKTRRLPTAALRYSKKVIDSYKLIRHDTYELKRLLKKIRTNWKKFLQNQGFLKEVNTCKPCPENPQNQIQLARFLWNLAPAITDSSQKAIILTNIASIYLYINKLDTSLIFLKRALKYEPDNSIRYAKIGRVLVGQGRYRTAMKFYEKADALDSGSSWICTALGELSLIQGKDKIARNYFRRAIELDSQNFRAVNNMGVANILTGDYSKAKKQFQAVVKADSASFLAWYNLSVAHLLELQTQSGFSESLLCGLTIELCDTLSFYTVKEHKRERPFDWPVEQSVSITSYFGWRPNPMLKNTFYSFVFHNGIDINGQTGDKILAPADGVVKSTTYDHRGYGNSIVIEHIIKDVECVTRYYHLSRIKVNDGQKIKRGEIIGLMGNTGRSTGSHLHFMIERNGEPVDPLEYLKLIEPYSWRM